METEIDLEPLSQKHIGRDSAIVIVGAGIAGLTACSTLMKAGFTNIVVLEAEGRIGGRAHSWEEEDGSVFELGAGWLHYSSTKLYKLCDSLGYVARHPHTNVAIDDDDVIDHVLIFSEEHKPLPRNVGDCITEQSMSVVKLADWLRPEYRLNNGSEHGDDSDDGGGEFECARHVSNPLECAVGDFVLQQYEKLKQKVETGSELYRIGMAGLDLGVRIMLENEGGQSLYNLSSVGHSEESGSGAYNTRLQVPLSVLVARLRADVPDRNIWLNCSVQNISFNDNNKAHQKPISITYASATRRNVVLQADHVIFTGSMGVLKAKQASIFTSPPLSYEKQRAIELFGWGNMGKIFFKYPVQQNGKTWWQNNLAKWGEHSRQLLDPNEPFSMNMAWLNDDDGCRLANITGQVYCAGRDGDTGKTCKHNWTRQIAGVYFIPIMKRSLSHNGEPQFERDFSWCKIMLPGSITEHVDRLSNEQVLADFNAFMREMVGDANAPGAERVVRHRWSLETNYLGTYSHCSVGCAREFGTSGADVVAEPEWWYNPNGPNNNFIKSKVPGLMFAGEATYTEGLGYMHGAYETGLREAKRVIDAYDGKR